MLSAVFEPLSVEVNDSLLVESQLSPELLGCGVLEEEGTSSNCSECFSAVARNEEMRPS